MEKKYVVKDFERGLFYSGGGVYSDWVEDSYLAHLFEDIQEAERFINREDGKFQIEVVYVV